MGSPCHARTRYRRGIKCAGATDDLWGPSESDNLLRLRSSFSLMSVLQNEKVAAAGKKLDAKLIALAIHATGADA
jgi:hypothetical protein